MEAVMIKDLLLNNLWQNTILVHTNNYKNFTEKSRNKSLNKSTVQNL